MNVGRTVFAQLLDHLPSYEFQKCVTRYRGDYQQKAFSCWDQYLAMAFAQLTYRDSLRDIEACLRSMQGKLYFFTLCSAFFVVRTKENVLLQRRYSHTVDKSTGVRSDHTVILTAMESARVYPDALRRVSYFDAETNKRLKFLTNNFTLPALTIAQTYRCRWQVELFFRWIKQHLRIKSFFGTSENAVKTQIWIAVSVYVLVAIVRKRLGLQASLYQILQILSVTLFEKVPILRALEVPNFQSDLVEDRNQLILFSF